MRFTKHVLFLIVLSLVLVSYSSGQNTPTDPGDSTGRVCEGDFLIDGNRSDTEQIIAEVSDCGVITGNLEILDTSLEDLGFLANLTSVGGDLSIRNNAVLTSLDSLAGITKTSSGIVVF